MLYKFITCVVHKIVLWTCGCILFPYSHCRSCTNPFKSKIAQPVIQISRLIWRLQHADGCRIQLLSDGKLLPTFSCPCQAPKNLSNSTFSNINS